ncbi:MAG: ABC transporter permease [Bacteroidetes bacterium CG18_big_fil_WC_8_21_14_2_50_41_14]|nr:MAG: ABC transporter permease [Bacteroidetes bacterium CG18_big_fil_WC_8_21_14_2_50_41_14]PJB58781.1 MAG: ABC transporter permease [Bacteroidetes bacterium CG_4_9_14_3_um_filter_41_19]
MISEIGKYLMVIFQAFKKPDKGSVFIKQLVIDFRYLGVSSIGLVAFISLFTGGIIALQTAYNIDNPLVPMWLIGYTTKQMMILEFSPTIISLILVGKVGSSIASEIGTMRVTQQIDALEVMGINPANYLILPKITAAMIYNPILIVFSMGVGLFGGWFAVVITGQVTSVAFVDGLQSFWDPFSITYALIKTVVFAFILASVAGYKGFTVQGGSVEVGKASTQAVVISSVLIIIFDLLLTQMLLT